MADVLTSQPLPPAHAVSEADGRASEKAAAADPSPNDDNEIITIEEIRKNPDGISPPTVHKYLRGKLLGKGGFAKVYWCTSLDSNKTYAIKIVPKANLVKSRARQKVCGQECQGRRSQRRRACADPPAKSNSPRARPEP